MENQILEHKRHTLSHILASVLIEKYKDIKITLGPAIDTGFYYDIDFGNNKIPNTIEEFEEIAKAMQEKIKSGGVFSHKEISKEEALEFFKGNEYKIELINEISQKGEEISLYTIDFKDGNSFTDLCRGGHEENISHIDIESFKITHTAGAYWRGNSENKMLTRVYGLAFNNKKELEEYESRLEEAKKRDHRKLGKELNLFTFSEYIGSGLPLYTEKGALIRRLLNEYIEELQTKAGYTQVWTPQLAKADLFKKSGHYDKYKDSMFRVISNYSKEEFFLKPMNCPQHTQIYSSQPRSYRDLPIRFTDFAMLYRDEQPGELNGLARVRSFSQDDCHIFCTEEQVDHEIDVALEMTKKVMNTFGFKYKYRLSTRDLNNLNKYLGNPETWDKVEKWAETIMQRNKIEYIPGPGEAAFYAPKMDLIATDALGREWQLSTVQIDFVMPERFDLEYTDKDGSKKHPVMLHRAIIGSPERFIMILLESTSGNLPLWLSPTQLSIIPINAEAHGEYAKNIFEKLKERNFRIELEDSKDGLGKKVRYAKDMKYPYWIVIGNKEVEENKVTLESRSGEKFNLTLEELIEKLEKEVKEKI